MSVSGVSQLKKLSELPQGVEAVVVKMKLEQGEADRLSDLGSLPLPPPPPVRSDA